MHIEQSVDYYDHCGMLRVVYRVLGTRWERNLYPCIKSQQRLRKQLHTV